jgi:ribosome biogenesis GTPase / thiamine phosphate phosphatase
MDIAVSLLRLGWTIDRQVQLEGLDPALVPARVGVEHRGFYGLLGCPVETAQLAGKLRLAAPGDADWPAVGDWVAVQLSGDLGLIREVLPRTTVLSRRRPLLAREQVVAANVDRVFVVTSPGRDLNPRRVERYLAAVWASGARPVLVLNKADLAGDPGSARDQLAAMAPGVTSLATSAATGSGVPELRAQIPSGQTAVLVGSSGVGKSSLLNALLGEERLSTRQVRITDEKGRHTTTRRELIELPGAGCLIDTPGMREFGLWEASPGVDQTFADVETLASGCRFRDCRHEGEPGCAVAQAVADGKLGGDRLASFEKLRREQAFLERQRDPRTQDRTKRRWKSIHKGIRARRKVDPKLRED